MTSNVFTFFLIHVQIKGFAASVKQKDRAIYLAVVVRYQARLVSHLPYYRLKGFIIMTLKDKVAREQYSRIYF